MTADRYEQWMREALRQAQQAFDEQEVPVGAVVVCQGRVVGRGRNRKEALRDPSAHAEILALREAASALGAWRLTGCTVFVTLEPCPMCMGAMLSARVAGLVYGCDDPKAGAARSLYRLSEDERFNHRFPVTGGVLAEPAAELLRRFFRLRR